MSKQTFEKCLAIYLDPQEIYLVRTQTSAAYGLERLIKGPMEILFTALKYYFLWQRWATIHLLDSIPFEQTYFSVINLKHLLNVRISINHQISRSNYSHHFELAAAYSDREFGKEFSKISHLTTSKFVVQTKRQTEWMHVSCFPLLYVFDDPAEPRDLSLSNQI